MAKEKMLDRRPAAEGENFWVEDVSLARTLIGSNEPGLCEVKPKTGGDRGQWFCITCCQPLQNNFDKDSHCQKPAPRKSATRDLDPTQPKAKHILAWRSFESGKLEVP